ncbi:DMT family transporter [Streptomyces griseus]|uniref:DMT family transporter n=1 Tax=Streptomyces griseus TaxID=1911 RepID=UPI00056A42A7|nr:DMT family transporter [Streptomyces griseus]
MSTSTSTDTSPSPARTARTGTALLVLAGVLWGTGGLAGSLLASSADLHPAAVAAYRLLTGGALITAYTAATGRLRSMPRTRPTLTRIATSGVLLALFQAAYFAAVEATSAGLAALTTMVAVPVLVTTGSAVMARRLPTARATTSILVAAGGLVLLLDSPTTSPAGLARGTALSLLAAAGFATLTLTHRTELPAQDQTTTTGLSFLAGGLLLLPVGLATGMALNPRPDTLAALAFLALFPTALAYTTYFAGLRRATPTTGVIAVLLEPLTATALSVLLQHTPLTATQTVGAAAVLTSIALQPTTDRTDG